MSKNHDSSPRVRDFYARASDPLRLRPLFGNLGFGNPIRPDASGKIFSNLQVWSQKDADDLARSAGTEARSRIERRFEAGTACIIFAEGLTVPADAEELARRHGVALFRSELTKKAVLGGLRRILSEFFPKKIVISGELLQIFGLGVLITGDSGVGKSECALELISRGHRFVSDDVTEVKRTAASTLLGSAPALSQNFMEIRGLSIINIEHIFGEKAISPRAELDLCIYLERWESGKEYDRLGLESPGSFEILGVPIPQITIPVAPGRNISTLIEVACKVHILRKKGYHAPRDLAQRLDRALTSK